jgi:pSer/pThr/pTyr-binding forkhead associated (FHA) protein
VSEGQRDSDVPFEIPDEDDELMSSLDEESSEPVITSSIEFPEGASWTTTSGGSASGSGPHGAISADDVETVVAELAFQGPGVKEVSTVDTAVFQIGRTNGDRVIDDRFLNPYHCQLRRDRGTYLLEDLGSANGVYLRIADELLLEDFDEFICGTQRFVFRTTWDAPTGAHGPHVASVPALGAAMPTDAARVLVYLAGGLVGGIYPVGDSLEIGRDSDDMSISSDPDLSRQHAQIVRTDDGYLLRDLQSTFGTFVRIHDPVELIDGDCFVIGRTRVSVRYP